MQNFGAFAFAGGALVWSKGTGVGFVEGEDADALGRHPLGEAKHQPTQQIGRLTGVGNRIVKTMAAQMLDRHT